MRVTSLLTTFALTIILFLSTISQIQSFCFKENMNGIPVEWTDDIRVTDFSNNDIKVSINAEGSDIYLVWERTVVVSSDYEVYFTKSNDSRHSWDSPQQISNSGIYATSPDIGIFNSNIHVVWGDWKTPDWEIFYRNSSDRGENWNSEKMISVDDSFNSEGPKIFVNNSNIHISWMDLRDGNDGEIYYRRSLDGGNTFDNGLGVDEDRRITSSPAAITATTMSGDGSNISVVWSDIRDGDWEIYWMISKDNGFSWEDGLGTPNVGRKISDDTTDSGPAAVVVNGSQIHIVWIDEEWPGPDYRLFYRNSINNGFSWNPIQLLTGPTSMIASPDIAVWEDNIHVVWDDSRDDVSPFLPEIYYKNSSDGGTSWSGDIRLTYNEGNHSEWPRLAINNSVVHVTWWDERDGNDEIYYKRYPDFSSDLTHNITLDEGWNLLSLPLEQSNELIDQVLSSIKVGFWINITEPGGVNLTVSGIIPTSTSINLYAGSWNLVGYPTLNSTTTVANALFGTTADRVLVADTSEPYHIKEVGPAYVMKPGEGYWVHVVADTVWIVDW
jgi:hypothetical protein